MKNLTVEGLREVLAEMPPEADVVISGLCIGRITALQITYDEETNTVWFNQRKRALEFDYDIRNEVQHR